MITIWLLTTLGAIWRYVDGRDWSYEDWNVSLYLFLLFGCVYLFGPEVGTWVAFGTACNILAGYKLEIGEFRITKGWHDWAMGARFFLVAMLTILPVQTHLDYVGIFTYLGATIVAGYLFPLTTWMSEKYDIRYPHEVNEIFLGATLIGGLAWLA